MYTLIFAYLVSPVHLHCIVGTFRFFLFSFIRAHKKHKNANKRMSYFFPLRCFKHIFYFCSLVAFRTFAWLRFCAFSAFGGAFGAFGAFCALKTALITSFISLLNLSYYKREFFLITIFFNYRNLL